MDVLREQKLYSVKLIDPELLKRCPAFLYCSTLGHCFIDLRQKKKFVIFLRNNIVILEIH